MNSSLGIPGSPGLASDSGGPSWELMISSNLQLKFLIRESLSREFLQGFDLVLRDIIGNNKEN